MNYLLIGILAGIVVVALWIVGTYNSLVNLRMRVERQASHVEVHLKKKFDMVPALVEAVKGYAKHEKDILEEVTSLRSQWGASKSSNEKIKTANMLESTLSKLLIVQERYPQLKADRSFMNIQKNISYVEGELVHERKIYNKRVSFYNVKLQEFPSSIIAKTFKFEEKPFFSFETSEE